MPLKLFLAIILSASALEWQDCNLMTDVPYLRVQLYRHFPDPEISSLNHTITKDYLYSGFEPLNNLKETVNIDTSNVAPSDPSFDQWVPYFNNSFELCEGVEKSVCPVKPGTVFRLSDTHPPSNSPGAWFRAVEHYYSGSDQTWIGCATIVYQTV